MDRKLIKIIKRKRKNSFGYIMECRKCGKRFEIGGRDYRRGRGIYCSDKCNGKMKSGNNNGRWGGGKKIANGYRFIHKNKVDKKYHYLMTHNIYIPEHRLIAAKKYNIKLTSKNIIHHLNGIRDDNRPENLVIVTAKKHEKWTLVKKLQKRICELEKKK